MNDLATIFKVVRGSILVKSIKFAEVLLQIFNGEDNYFMQEFMFMFAFTTFLECTESSVFS